MLPFTHRYQSLDITPPLHIPKLPNTKPLSQESMSTQMLQQLNHIQASHPKAFVSVSKKFHKSLDNKLLHRVQGQTGKKGGYINKLFPSLENKSLEILNRKLPPILKNKSTSNRQKQRPIEHPVNPTQPMITFAQRQRHSTDILHPDPSQNSLNLNNSSLHNALNFKSLITQHISQVQLQPLKHISRKVYRKSKSKQHKNQDLFTKQGWNYHTKAKWLASFISPN